MQARRLEIRLAEGQFAVRGGGGPERVVSLNGEWTERELPDGMVMRTRGEQVGSTFIVESDMGNDRRNKEVWEHLPAEGRLVVTLLLRGGPGGETSFKRVFDREQ